MVPVWSQLSLATFPQTIEWRQGMIYAYVLIETGHKYARNLIRELHCMDLDSPVTKQVHAVPVVC